MNYFVNKIKKRAIILGIVIAIIYFLVHLSIVNHYGLSWDFHYHHYGGLYHLGLPVPKVDQPSPAPFTSPDPRLTYADPFGPFTQMIPSASYVLFFEKLKIFPADVAYNLPMVILGSLGVLLLFLFLFEAWSVKTAIWGSIFLALLPNYFGYLHNNMKDIPNAFFFTLAIYTFWRLVKYKRTRYLILAIVPFSFAFNVKVNSIMVPVILFAWYVLTNISEVVRFTGSVVSPSEESIRLPRRSDFVEKLILSYFFIAPVAAILLWWPFWADPLGKLLQIPSFYSQNTLNMPVLYWGKVLKSGVNIPWHYPYSYIAITTPLPILISLIIGLFIALKKALSKDKFTLLLLLWLFVPLLRYFNPRIGAIDGVRHFMEIVYPLSAIAGIGVVWLIKKLGQIGRIISVAIILSLLTNIVHFHPYQTSYFNLLIGGIRGAEGKFDIDFWGTPQREAMIWLNDNAEESSNIHVVMAQSTASLYLRDDLKKQVNIKDMRHSDYTVVLNRESFFSIYDAYNYLKEKKISGELVFQKTIDGVPLVWVFRN